MNARNKQKISIIYDLMSTLLDELQQEHDDMEEKNVNVPEYLQATERYESSVEAVDELDSAITSIQEGLGTLDVMVNQ